MIIESLLDYNENRAITVNTNSLGGIIAQELLYEGSDWWAVFCEMLRGALSMTT